MEPTGFTLVEVLLAVLILSLIVAVVSELLSGAQMTISLSRKLLDCDDQARLAFGRMENDFEQMVKRNDVDFIFAKQAGNDKIFFYSQAVGEFGGTTLENPVSLVGYTVGPDPNIKANIPNDLQRLGRALNWLPGSTGRDNMVFLTASPTTTNYFAYTSMLDGHWNSGTGASYNSIGTPPAYNPTAPLDPDYHVIGAQIFRFEYCFLLRDGSYSDYPVEENSANVPSGAVACITTQSRPPRVTDDSKNSGGAGVVATGTRWFDTNAGRAYICTNPMPGAAVWQGLGVQDVAAIIVALAVLDPTSQTLLYSAGGSITDLPSLFPDSGAGMNDTVTGFVPAADASNTSKLMLMQQSWKAKVNAASFVSSVASATGVSSGLAKQIAAHISTYQRYFYLNAAASL
jgi:prepilin-type N-terminal cleavage/methylation domain-containing protein